MAIVPQSPVVNPLLTSEKRRPRMAKASLRKAETDANCQSVGRAIDRARQLCGWNLDEFALAVKRDSRQCARWINGSERAQLDALFAVVLLRQPLIQALSELAGEEVEVTIRMRRRV